MNAGHGALARVARRPPWRRGGVPRVPGVAVAVIALLAVALAAAALTVALTGRQSDPYNLVCGEAFHDAQTGRTVPMFVPCSRTHP